jgi:hypothetical protein
MGKKILLTIMLGLMVFSFSTAVLAQEDKEERPTCNLSWSFYSKYVWRGYELSKDSLVMFPTITVSYKGFSMNMWGDLDTSYKGNIGEESTNKWWETDWILSYSNSWKKLNYTFGWIYYDIDPSTFTRASQELFTTVGLDVLLKPSLSVYREIALGGERWYINLGVTHTFPIVKREILGFCGEQTLDVGGWISYLTYKHNTTKADGINWNGMHDANIWAAYNIPLNSFITIIPSINYSFPLSNKAQREIGHASFDAVEDFSKGAEHSGGNSQFVYGGVTLKVAF